MGKEYVFYPYYKKLDKFVPLLKNYRGQPASVFWRSGSFIEGDFFTDKFRMIEPVQTDLDFFDKFSGYGEWEFENPTHIYDLPEKELERYAGDGLMSGYVDIETAREIEDNMTDFLHYESEYSMISPAIFADMAESERAKYVKIFGIDYWGKEYICSHLLKILSDITTPSENELGYLMLFSF